MSMKKLFFLFAFLVGLGISSSVYAQLTKPITLNSPNTLASELGENAGKVTALIVSGPLGTEDFKTMKEQMGMLQVLDMSGVTELPKAGGAWADLRYIPANSFQNKLTLRKVIFPGVLQMIEQEAFSGCSTLTDLDFSKATQLQRIGYNAFYECSGLLSLDLSANVDLVEIGSSVFRFCSNLVTVNLAGCAKLANIESWTFSNCVSLQTVDLSSCSALTTLGSSAFSSCGNLTSVRLKGCNSLVTISERAFSGCRQLSDFDFSQLIALKEIGQEAFYGCALVGDIAFASGLTQIGSRAFQQNEGITSIDFSKSTQLAAVSSGTFDSCWNLKKVDFSNCVSLNTLNISAFDMCSSLEEVVIDNGFYTSIAGVLFVVDKATLLLYPGGRKDASYTIPSTVMTLGEHSFPYNESLMELTIPTSVRTIKGKAFNGSFSGRGAKVIMEAAKPIKLSQSIGLDNSLVYVPKGSAKSYRLTDFWKDSKIVEIDADPVTVTLDAAGTLGAKLTELNIPLVSILELNIIGPMNASDFEIIKQMELLQKAGLSKATMEGDKLPNNAFCNNTNDSPILLYLREVILPNTIKEIGGYAFCRLSALQKVNIPKSVERIGEYAFSSCSSLQKIDLSSLSQLREIGSYAFSSSSCVPTSLKFPDGLEAIDWEAFSNTGVTSVDFSNTSLYNIDGNAFNECPIIGALSFPGTLRSISNSAFASAKVSSITLRSTEMVRLDGTDVFKSVDKTKCKVYVPKGLKDTYKANTYWSPFGNNIVEYGQMITVTTNKGYGGWVEGGGAYEKGESVTVKAIAQNGIFFDGWYENGKKISTEPELTFKMGETDRSLEARFYNELMVFDDWKDHLINDQNKVDGPAVILHSGNLTVKGEEIWRPKSFAFYRGTSLLVNSDIQTGEISFNWDTWGGDWYFVSFPYDLKMSEIKFSNSDDARLVVREYDGKSRADKGVGASWRQLSDSETLKANTGYIIQFNSGDGMADAFTSKTGDMKALFNRESVTTLLNTYASANIMDANWNFVGNPFPAYYSVEQLFADGLDATVTVWSPELNNYEYYTQDDKGVYLPPLTAFFVQKNKSNLKFSPEGRIATLSTAAQTASALRNTTDNRQVINLLLTGEKASDRTRVVFNEEASLEYEIGLDAAKFSSPNVDAVAFYSLDKEGNRLAINERPVGDGVVRLGCVLPAKGSYTISLKEKIGGGIQLVDKQTGAVCDLNKEAYTFEAEAGTLSDRFELKSDVVTSVEAIDASVRWNVREGLLIVSGLRDVETLSVCDAAGRIHFTGKATDGEVRIALPQPGIYYMTWTTKAGERQTRSIKW